MTEHYIELHSRSAFSFLEGASVPEELIAVCKGLEMPAMALLDRDGVYGSPRFHLAAQKLGIKAHIGAEITVQSPKESPKSKVQSPKSKTKESPKANSQHPKSEEIVAGQTLDIGLWTLDKDWTLDKAVHRRDALWQVERVARPAGELYEELHEQDSNSPLVAMTRPERMDADFRGTGLTIGRHPVAYRRAELSELGASRAIDLQQLRDGSAVKVGGWVIVRQRPGTAKGFVFLTMEDETGVANIIITPQLFDKYRLVVVDEPFLLISGKLQNQDNVISVKAKTIRALSFQVAAVASHDFH